MIVGFIVEKCRCDFFQLEILKSRLKLLNSRIVERNTSETRWTSRAERLESTIENQESYKME